MLKCWVPSGEMGPHYLSLPFVIKDENSGATGNRTKQNKDRGNLEVMVEKMPILPSSEPK